VSVAGLPKDYLCPTKRLRCILRTPPNAFIQPPSGKADSRQSVSGAVPVRCPMPLQGPVFPFRILQAMLAFLLSAPTRSGSP
jgi:hypothetical protein